MTSQFPELAEALEAYFAAIAEQKSAHPPALMPHILKLDELGQQFSASAPPMLQHYLERKSYEKALKFLKGEVSEHH
jgi:hypothetical protein